MKHLGRFIVVPAGYELEVHTTRYPDAPYTRVPGACVMKMCDACGHWWPQDGKPSDPNKCDPPCLHCGQALEQHAGDRCLFAPTRFEMVRFVVKRDGVTF